MAYTLEDIERIIEFINKAGTLNTASTDYKNSLLYLLNNGFPQPGDVIIPANSSFYIGDPIDEGTWRFRRDGIDLVFERNVDGDWVEFHRIGD